MVARCPGCGHNFYRDRSVEDGLCVDCVRERREAPNRKCSQCGKPGIQKGNLGYLCGDPDCVRSDGIAADIEAQLDVEGR